MNEFAFARTGAYVCGMRCCAPVLPAGARMHARPVLKAGVGAHACMAKAPAYMHLACMHRPTWDLNREKCRDRRPQPPLIPTHTHTEDVHHARWVGGGQANLHHWLRSLRPPCQSNSTVHTRGFLGGAAPPASTSHGASGPMGVT